MVDSLGPEDEEMLAYLKDVRATTSPVHQLEVELDFYAVE